ncbi:unnamed protein product, partial [Ectocarpus sp. 12 AP-2014]
PARRFSPPPPLSQEIGRKFPHHLKWLGWQFLHRVHTRSPPASASTTPFSLRLPTTRRRRFVLHQDFHHGGTNSPVDAKAAAGAVAKKKSRTRPNRDRIARMTWKTGVRSNNPRCLPSSTAKCMPPSR